MLCLVQECDGGEFVVSVIIPLILLIYEEVSTALRSPPCDANGARQEPFAGGPSKIIVIEEAIPQSNLPSDCICTKPLERFLWILVSTLYV